MTDAKSIMNIPVTIGKNSTIFDVIMKLEDEKISRLLVADDNNSNSIVTEKDVGLFLLTDFHNDRLCLKS